MPGLRGNTWAPRPKATGFARPSTRPGGTIGPGTPNVKRPGAGGAKTGAITDRSTKPKKMMAGARRKIPQRPPGPPKAYVGAREKKAQATTRETRGSRQQFTPWMPPGQQAGTQQMQFSTQAPVQQQPDLLAQRLGNIMGGAPQQPVQQQYTAQAQSPFVQAGPANMGQPVAVGGGPPQAQQMQPQVMPWRSPLMAQTPGIGQPQPQPQFNPYQQGGQMPYRPMYNTGFGGGYGRY